MHARDPVNSRSTDMKLHNAMKYTVDTIHARTPSVIYCFWKSQRHTMSILKISVYGDVNYSSQIFLGKIHYSTGHDEHHVNKWIYWTSVQPHRTQNSREQFPYCKWTHACCDWQSLKYVMCHQTLAAAATSIHNAGKNQISRSGRLQNYENDLAKLVDCQWCRWWRSEGSKCTGCCRCIGNKQHWCHPCTPTPLPAMHSLNVVYCMWTGQRRMQRRSVTMQAEDVINNNQFGEETVTKSTNVRCSRSCSIWREYVESLVQWEDITSDTVCGSCMNGFKGQSTCITPWQMPSQDRVTWHVEKQLGKGCEQQNCIWTHETSSILWVQQSCGSTESLSRDQRWQNLNGIRAVVQLCDS